MRRDVFPTDLNGMILQVGSRERVATIFPAGSLQDTRTTGNAVFPSKFTDSRGWHQDWFSCSPVFAMEPALVVLADRAGPSTLSLIRYRLHCVASSRLVGNQVFARSIASVCRYGLTRIFTAHQMVNSLRVNANLDFDVSP